MVDILPIPVLGDTYAYLVVDGSSAVAIDPGDDAPVADQLRGRGLSLEAVLVTHLHADHTGGAAALGREARCRVAGPAVGRISCVDTRLADHQILSAAGIAVRALHVPGHTAGHLAFFVEEDGLLFTGDTLFAAGCGRLFEGTARQMWESLRRLAALPDTTRVFCGHEYTEDNLRFALSILPGSAILADCLDEVRRQIARSGTSMPTTIGREKETNLFLRCDDPAVAAALGMTGAPPHDVFAELRGRKDRF